MNVFLFCVTSFAKEMSFPAKTAVDNWRRATFTTMALPSNKRYTYNCDAY